MTDTRNMVKKGNVWFARIGIPKEIRHVFKGKTFFVKTTGESDPHRAYKVAAPMLAMWRDEILMARQHMPSDLMNEWTAYAHRWVEMFPNIPKDDPSLVGSPERPPVAWLVGFVNSVRVEAYDLLAFRTMPQIEREQLPPYLNPPRTDMVPLAWAHKQLAKAGVTTLFLDHLDAWVATRRPGKTIDQYVKDVQRFASTLPDAIEDWADDATQSWAEERLKEGMGIGTVKRYLTALNQYWEYLQSHKIVAKTHQPFEVSLKDLRNPVEIAEAEELPYTPDQLLDLLERCRDDQPLNDLIRLAMYTGARRESLVVLNKSSVATVDGIECLHFQDKTANGIRDVPIHSSIREILDRLMTDADRRGFLFHTSKQNKYNHGDQLGKRFGRLKQTAGFGPRYNFRSIRKTVAGMFLRASTPEAVVAQILGHKHKPLTFGLYARGTTITALKRDEIEYALRFTDAERASKVDPPYARVFTNHPI